ncbi:hypothetical protein NSK_004993 [Nannochloropsis salina CCMP1776]|uniref:glutathione gamma-glutamylcysteinyltransferase n=1 Tax=Nannochloropsis salina CCMP1776 TaxID=1027361 RepID=A0A4D9CY06_9STRA|nr:hypothetical protein NSK_004993 [Nannochloropsis salina CCMP1776]|eukprot:TFJ83896.1 hypothetical protein NSK_004993 [Nannochloropsis salina CCMP1776]
MGVTEALPSDFRQHVEPETSSAQVSRPHSASEGDKAVVIHNSAKSIVQSFYRRQLPTSHCVPFNSSEGRRLFQEALMQGGLESYFPLSEQFKTQDDPAFCGLGALTMVLNALAIDPGRTWKGPWRWFDESMLECCEPLEVVRERGICLGKLDCLARCNGATTVLKYGDSTGLDEFRRDIIRTTGGGREACHGGGKEGATDFSRVPGTLARAEHTSGSEQTHVQYEQQDLLVVGYNRQVLGQTGSGHFSPVGGYHAGRDMALIMDVARFKYPPHWVPVPLLWEAMQTVDPETQRSRGYMVVAKGMVSESLLFTIDKSRYEEFKDLASWIRKAAERLPLLMEAEMTRNAGMPGGESGGTVGAARLDHDRLLPLFLESLPASIASMFVTIHESFCLRYSEKHLKSIGDLLGAIEAHPIYETMGAQHEARLDRFRTPCSRRHVAAEEACCAGKVVNERHVLTILYISMLEWVCQRQKWSIFGLFPAQTLHSPPLQLEVAQLKRKIAAMADEMGPR